MIVYITTCLYKPLNIIGDIVKKMCNGIDKTKCVIVFVTDNYVKKVDSSNFNDNCQLEFKYSMRQKSGKLYEYNLISICDFIRCFTL